MRCYRIRAQMAVAACLLCCSACRSPREASRAAALQNLSAMTQQINIYDTISYLAIPAGIQSARLVFPAAKNNAAQLPCSAAQVPVGTVIRHIAVDNQAAAKQEATAEKTYHYDKYSSHSASKIRWPLVAFVLACVLLVAVIIRLVRI